ncbi:hypothetical protein KRM28CT15_53860 [Krasilnikovia sp. M28-CT-15]
MRHGPHRFTADVPSLRHVAVWLRGTSPGASEVQRFWAETAWVPIAETDWFADLAIHGEFSGYR